MRVRYSVEYDGDANALYLRVKDGTIEHTVELEDSILVDLDDHDQALGVEFLEADRFAPFLATIPRLQERVDRMLRTKASAAD